MATFFRSLIISMSMFSAVPMPMVEWDDKSLINSFSFMPLIGVIIGGVEYLWHWFAIKNGINLLFYSVVAVVIPIIISGGIHIDGFIDSCDAVASRADKETRIKILADPNVGAFGVIYFVVYILLNLGIYSQAWESSIYPFTFMVVYGLSRAIGGVVALYGKSAKTSGLKHSFTKSQDKAPVKVVLFIWIWVFIVCLAWISLWTVVFAVCVVGGFLLYFRHYTNKIFGGITGDLIGFVITISELLLLSSLLFSKVLV